MSQQHTNLKNRVVQADFVYLSGKFRSNIQLRCDSKGKIAEIGEKLSSEEPVIRLPGQALLPGMVNGHSHSFHRGLRGISEKSNTSSEQNFWSWRDTMYSLVTKSSESDFYALSKDTFDEMLRSGITTVGEFHYWHHHKARELLSDSELYKNDLNILKGSFAHFPQWTVKKCLKP